VKAEKGSFSNAGQAFNGQFGSAVVILFGALLLMWPTLLNRSPFFLSDTSTYIRGADAASFRIFHVQTPWSDRFLGRYQPEQIRAARSESKKAASSHERPVTLSGRSIYYGAFLYVAERIAGLRLAVLFQALAVAVCLRMTVNRFDRRTQNPTKTFLLTTGLLSVASPLAFFVGYLMPDVFTGLAILAVANLLCGEPPLRHMQRVFWFIVLCWSMLVHSSNLLILLLILAVAMLVRFWWGRPQSAAVGLAACAFLIGVSGEALFNLSVREFSGDAPVRPPFLMTRLIADGPGLTYLERTCPGSGFAVCRHMQGLSRSSDAMLWNTQPDDGLFSAVDNDERRLLAEQETRFVLAVIADRPFAVVLSTARSILNQAQRWHLDAFNMSPAKGASIVEKLPPGVGLEVKGSLSFGGKMPVRPIELMSLAMFLISAGFIIRALAGRSINADTKLFLLIVISGIVADIVVCGAISTPHDRYSMRVLWLLPLSAAVVWMNRRTQHGSNSSNMSIRPKRVEAF